MVRLSAIPPGLPTSFVSNMKSVIGIDLGTDSVRALVIQAENGKELDRMYRIIHVGKWECIVMHRAINGDSIP